MTQLNHTPVAEKVPCHSCSASAEALGILSMSLQTAIQAAQYIRIPLPDIAPANERFNVVPKEEIPEEFRQVCEWFGYNLVHAFKRPNVEANNGSPDVVEAIIGEERDAEAMDGLPASSSPQLPSSRDSDAISINLSSTDWEEEYGVTATPPPSSATAVPSPAPTPVSSLPTITAEEGLCWYAVIVGRNPGVFSGSAVSHNATSNVSEVPGGFARRYNTQELAQAAYDAALDAGQVVKVTYVVSKRTLSRPSV